MVNGFLVSVDKPDEVVLYPIQAVHRRAFTLIELIVVIVVLAILSGVATVKYLDYSGKAKDSAEAAVVGAVRAGLGHVRANAAVRGTTPWPASLDGAALNTPASNTNPLFNLVLDAPVTQGWSKGANSVSYVSAAGNTYVYDPSNGTFDLAGAAGGAAADTQSASNTPKYTNVAAWIAGVDPPTGMYGYGYGLNGNDLMLTDAYGSFSEAARRVTIGGQQAIQAGTFTVKLDTMLSNYYNQLNYWMVVGVKNGTTIGLSGDTMRWGTTYPGVKTLYADYAPPEKSDGNWYAYTGTFTVSAADAANYDQIVVVMAGSKFSSQQLGWRNVSLTKAP